jgi:hypothetical protein
MDLTNAIITGHAASQMRERQITPEQVGAVLAKPEEVLPIRAGRVVAQAVQAGYLLRVFVDVDRNPPEVVTAYRTSKIDKSAS